MGSNRICAGREMDGILSRWLPVDVSGRLEFRYGLTQARAIHMVFNLDVSLVV